MVKHTQKIRRQQPTNCLSVFNHFVKLALKGLSECASTPTEIIRKDMITYGNLYSGVIEDV